MSSRTSIVAAVVCLATLGGCYENLQPEQQTATPPPQQQPVATESTTTGISNTPRPGLSGAKRAAHNTVEQSNQHQRRLEEAMEDDQ